MPLDPIDFQEQLIRGLAHRMNNVFTLFQGYLGLLLEDHHLDPKTQEALRKIQEGARGATDLMERTHSLVRPSKVVWREVDLGELLHQSRTAFRQFAGPNTVLEVVSLGNVPRVWADVSRLKTAIVEIVRNAAEATADGGEVRVELSAEKPTAVISPARQAPAWVSVKVSDTGPGIPAENQEKVFAPFFTTKAEAAGLGLTVAQAFVQQHGGVLRLNSAASGTRVEIRLPGRANPA